MKILEETVKIRDDYGKIRVRLVDVALNIFWVTFRFYQKFYIVIDVSVLDIIKLI